MLYAGWGYCGIDVESANNEYDLISSPKFDVTDHGKYFVSCRESRCHSDVYNDELRMALWNELEHLTGTTLNYYE
jgi:hypothetical protein